MISESGSDSSSTMSSPPLETTKTMINLDKIVAKKKKKKKTIRVDGEHDEEEGDDQRVKQPKKSKEAEREDRLGEAGVHELKKAIKAETNGGAKVNKTKMRDHIQYGAIKSESQDNRDHNKSQGPHERADKSHKSSSTRTREKKRYEETKIDGFTINAFRTWEDLQDELNERISANIKRNKYCDNLLVEDTDRAHASSSSSLTTDIGPRYSYTNLEPSSSGLNKSALGSSNGCSSDERNQPQQCNINPHKSSSLSGRSNDKINLASSVNQSAAQSHQSNHDISNGQIEYSGINRRHHEHRSTAVPPVLDRTNIDFKHSGQPQRQPTAHHQMSFHSRSCSPPPVPLPQMLPSSSMPHQPLSSHTAHHYIQQYQQLYQQMQNSARHPLQHNPFMQSFINHQQQHVQHHLPPPPPPPAAPSLPMSYMSPYTITDTIHTISRQTIIPPPMMAPPPPPSLSSLPGLDQLSAGARYGLGMGPGHLGPLDQGHFPSQPQSGYTPSPTERSFMEFARSYANASNISSGYSGFMNARASNMSAFPGPYPGVAGRQPTGAWRLPGW